MSNKKELKHHKDFHKVQLQNLTTKQRNLFMYLCFSLMEQDSKEIKFNIKQVLKEINYRPRGKTPVEFMEDFFDDISKLQMRMEDKNKLKKIYVFTGLEVEKESLDVKIAINQEYKYLLNGVKEPFTLQCLINYTALKSGYSQIVYSLLKQWDGKKEKEYDLIDFKEMLGVPETYDTNNFNKKVLAPIQTELTPLFEGLKLDKIKTGNKVTSLKFSWGTGGTIKKDTDMTEKKVTVSKMKNKAELLEQLKAAEKAYKKKMATQELINKQLEEKENIKNNQLEGFKKAKELMKEQLRAIEVSTHEKEIDLKASESLEINEIEQLEKEIFELDITKTTFRLIKADMKRIIKLNTMKTPEEKEVLETVLGVLKEIKDPFNVEMSESELKVIRDQAKKYKIKLDY